MQITVRSGAAHGTVSAPPSKSMAHRLLICAALSLGKSVIHGVSECEDVSATLDCIGALGASYFRNGDCITVYGTDMRNTVPAGPLLCRESGSTLRFLIPVAMLSENETRFCGAPSLMKRPMDIYATLFSEKKLGFKQNGEEITVKGRLSAGDYTVAGNVSSQFISGLLFALPLLDGDSTVHLIPPVESRSYLNLTVEALRLFGVCVEWLDGCTVRIPGGQHYCPQQISVEGDYSNAAFLEAFNFIGGNVCVTGLAVDSLQGDRVYQKYFAALENGNAHIDLSDCPDLAPILFSLAAVKHGGVFHGTRRLRMKESDRVAAMAEELKKFGTEVLAEEDSVTVVPKAFHAPDFPLNGHNDHRIVMSMTVLLTLTGGTVCGAEAVSKSFPDFFEKLRLLGLEVSEV